MRINKQCLYCEATIEPVFYIDYFLTSHKQPQVSTQLNSSGNYANQISETATIKNFHLMLVYIGNIAAKPTSAQMFDFSCFMENIATFDWQTKPELVKTEIALHLPVYLPDSHNFPRAHLSSNYLSTLLNIELQKIQFEIERERYEQIPLFFKQEKITSQLTAINQTLDINSPELKSALKNIDLLDLRLIRNVVVLAISQKQATDANDEARVVSRILEGNL
jgi:hypothetical protein